MLSLIFVGIGVILDGILLYLLAKKENMKEGTAFFCYDDGSPARFFITGDKHRNFNRVKTFCREMNTRKKMY